MKSRVGLVAVAVLAVGASAAFGGSFNLVTNESFEALSDDPAIPAGWFFFYSKIKNVEASESCAKTGTRSVKLSAQQVPSSHEGLAQIVPVEAGTTYTFSASVISSKTEALGKGSYGMIGIEWRRADNTEIGRIASPAWDSSLSRMRWETFRVTGEAPDGATAAAVVIYLYDTDKGGTGTCFVDDAKMEMQ